MKHLKDLFDNIRLELKECNREHGILFTLAFVILFLFIAFVSLPFLPFYILNECSKDWF